MTGITRTMVVSVWVALLLSRSAAAQISGYGEEWGYWFERIELRNIIVVVEPPDGLRYVAESDWSSEMRWPAGFAAEPRFDLCDRAIHLRVRFGEDAIFTFDTEVPREMWDDTALNSTNSRWVPHNVASAIQSLDVVELGPAGEVLHQLAASADGDGLRLSWPDSSELHVSDWAALANRRLASSVTCTGAR